MKVTVKVVGETIEVSAKFRKREFVGVIEGDYPQPIQFQLTQDKCNLLDGVQVGEEIDIEYNLRGREWTNPQGEVKVFNSLEVWKIDTMAKEMKSTSEKLGDRMARATIEDIAGDDLPF